MSKLAIHSNRTVMPHGVFEATTVIEEGAISMVVDGSGEGLDIEIIDVGDSVLMPGAIDAHVHINEPGREDWEGFDSATKAAAAGGVTSLVEMPLNSSPVTNSPEAFEEKLKAAEGKLHVNCGFWGGVSPENAGNLEPLLKSGVFGVKAFLIDSGLPEFPHVSQRDLRKAMPVIGKSGLPLLVHAELESEVDGVTVADYDSYRRSRPRRWEDNAIKMMIDLCRAYKCRTHIVHLSSQKSLAAIRSAKNGGLPFSIETCPHYLMFNAEDIPSDGTLYKCAPPIRRKPNNDKLWEAITRGEMNFITSDHSPAPPDIKHIDDHDFEKAWGGISGLQFLLPAFWTGAQAHGMQLNDVSRLLCEAPADFVGLDRKGKIAPGYDADLVIWDPEAKVDSSTEKIHHKHKLTPYTNLEMQGNVMRTYVGGELVYENGEFISLNQGKTLIRKQASS